MCIVLCVCVCVCVCVLCSITEIRSHAPNGVPIEYAAHQSDFLRLGYLVRDGGIYMDWDVISTGPIDDVLYSPVVFGAEKKVLNYKEALGVAWMAARRGGSLWLTRFLSEMGDKFQGKACYTCASVQLAKQLSLADPTGLRVLNYTSFYHPGWELDGVQRMLEPSQYSGGGDSMAHGYFYAMHLFESHANFQKYIARITLDWIRTVDTHFAAIIRPMLDYDENFEREQKQTKSKRKRS